MMNYKLLAKKVLPGFLVKLARIRRMVVLMDAWYDLARYIRFSSIINYDNDEEKLRAFITATYHNVEKGLSLPVPRPGFGRENIERLLSLIVESLDKYGCQRHLAVPLGALEKYVEFNLLAGHDVSWLTDQLAAIRTRCGVENEESGGTRVVTKQETLAAINRGGVDLILSRSTCRQYTDEVIAEQTIRQSVEVAQRAPAVCNRQSGIVRVFRKKSDIARVLSLQGGARGFADGVGVLFCVTVDIRNFNGPGERYQGWIDGGMFSMNLVLGLHAQGLGACCLNWSKDRHQDQAMRELIRLPENEIIIMFVAAGGLPNTYVVAKSVRKNLSEVMRNIEL